MIIISKTNGIFNTATIPCIKEFPSGTYAVFGEKRILITKQENFDKIARAIKNYDSLLEVE